MWNAWVATMAVLWSGCASKETANAAPSLTANASPSLTKYRPVEITRECFVNPPEPEHPQQSLVAIHTVLQTAKGAERQLTLALHLTCKYHGPHGGCSTDCPPGVDGNREMGYRANSWSCDVTQQTLDGAARGFTVPTRTALLGYVPAENWFGKSIIELHEHD